MCRRLCFILLLLWPCAAGAQPWPSLESAPQLAAVGANDVAVLVAIEDYAFVQAVGGARQNLAEWEVFLREGLGARTITSLLDEQATREEILAAADAAAQIAGPDSTVWFLFIGHGAPAPDGSDAMLLGVDAQQTPRSLGARGIARGDVLRRLEAGAQRRTVVLLDACFSGRLPDGSAIAPGIQPVIAVEDMTLGEGTVVMSAAGPSEVAGALPGIDRPAFSYLVLGGLRGWADDGDGEVTALEAVAFAKRELLTMAGRRQTPTVAGLVDSVLAVDANESRPLAEVAAIEQPSTEPARIATRTGPIVEFEPPARLALGVAVGAGAEVTYETGTLLLSSVLAFRLSNPARPTRFNLLVGVDYANVTNVYAREFESAFNEAAEGTSFRTSLDVADHSHMLSLTAGPGLELGIGKFRMFGDLRGGLALPLGGECRDWEVDEQLRATGCRNRTTDASPTFRARMGAGYGLVEVAAHAGTIPRTVTVPAIQDEMATTNEIRQTLFVAGMTVGVAFDL